MVPDTIHARDILEPVRSVGLDLPVRDLARILVDGVLDGVCVTDADGHLAGIVTAMDLLFQEKPVKGPKIFWLIDSPVVFGQSQFQHDLAKQTASTVKDVMTPRPTTVDEATGIDEIATLMVEHGFTILPVLRDGGLIGMISKWGMLRAVLRAGGRPA